MSINNMHFGVMPGKGSIDAIFIMQQVQEKHKAKRSCTMLLWRGGEMGFEEAGCGCVGHPHKLWHCMQRIAL